MACREDRGRCPGPGRHERFRAARRWRILTGPSLIPGSIPGNGHYACATALRRRLRRYSQQAPTIAMDSGPTEYQGDARLRNRLVIWLVWVPTVVCSILAALLYRYQDLVTPIVDSYDFCDDNTVMDLSEWIFPKIVAHCEAIGRGDLKIHPSSDIVIVIDIFVVLCFFLFLLLRIIIACKVPPDMSSKPAVKMASNRNKFWLYLAMAIAIFLICIYYIFFWMDIVPSGSSPFSRMSSMFHTSWGFGPAMQVFVLSQGASVSAIFIITVIRVRFLLTKDLQK